MKQEVKNKVKIEVDITREDYWKFNKYAIFNTPKFRNNYIITFTAMPILAIIAVIFFLKLPVHYSILVGIIFGGAVDILTIFFMKRQIMNLVKEKEGFLGRHAIEINEEGVRESTTVNESFNYWVGIHDIKQDKDNIYIFLNIIVAHIIPKRTFSSQNEETQFYNTALNYWNDKK